MPCLFMGLFREFEVGLVVYMIVYMFCCSYFIAELMGYIYGSFCGLFLCRYGCPSQVYSGGECGKCGGAHGANPLVLVTSRV